MWLISAALAAPGLELPEGEDPRRWRSAAQLAGIEVGCTTATTCVRVRVSTSAWELHVGSRQGAISPPVDEAGRAAVAWLAASLAQPLPVVAVIPPRPPRSTAPRPKPVAPEPAPEVAVAVVPEVVPEIVPEAPIPPPAEAWVEPEPPVPAPVVRPRPFLDVRLGGGAVLQPQVDPAAVGSAGVVVGLDRWSVEIGAEVSTAASLTPYDPLWTQSRVDVLAGLGYTPAPWLGLGVDAGVSRRAWADRGVPASATWLPLLDARVDVRVPGQVADVYVRVRPALDLRGVEVARGGSRLGRLAPFSLTAGAGVVLHAIRP